MDRRFFYLFAVTLTLIGCNPVAQVEEPVEDELSEQEIESTPTAASLAAIDLTKTQSFLILSDPWNQYFRGKPTVLLLSDLSNGVQSLIKEEQELIKAVLDSSSSVRTTSEYAALEERIEELKLAIPQAETSSGYVYRSPSRSYTYVSSSGNTVYIRRSNGYYSTYYSVFHNKNKSSSPALVRSVEGIAHNTTLEDIDQRITALQQIISQWNERTARMSVNGTEGIMRRANESYLDTLRSFAGEFVKIQSELRKIEAKQARVEANKAAILEEWQDFEANRLQVLDDYFTQNAMHRIASGSDDTYAIPADFKGDVIYACEIGNRTLYFEVSDQRDKRHPFVMVDMGSVDRL